MGIFYKYICNNCEYNVHSSSDIDCGMFAVIEPHICLDCQQVTSVLIGANGDIYSRYADNSGRFTKAEIDSFDKCGDCDSNNIKPWSKYNRRCPKCNNRMKQDKNSEVMLWD